MDFVAPDQERIERETARAVAAGQVSLADTYKNSNVVRPLYIRV